MTWVLVLVFYPSVTKNPDTQLLKISFHQSTDLPCEGGQPPRPHSESLVTVITGTWAHQGPLTDVQWLPVCLLAGTSGPAWLPHQRAPLPV